MGKIRGKFLQLVQNILVSMFLGCLYLILVKSCFHENFHFQTLKFDKSSSKWLEESIGTQMGIGFHESLHKEFSWPNHLYSGDPWFYPYNVEILLGNWWLSHGETRMSLTWWIWLTHLLLLKNHKFFILHIGYWKVAYNSWDPTSWITNSKH